MQTLALSPLWPSIQQSQPSWVPVELKTGLSTVLLLGYNMSLMRHSLLTLMRALWLMPKSTGRDDTSVPFVPTSQMLTDLNTYLNKAIPDTRLTIKKYLDVKFEYLVSGLQCLAS